MFERFTDRARRAIVLAQDEARDLGHEFISPEHLLLGLFQAGGVAATALSQMGADLDATRGRVAEATSSSHGARQSNKVPFSPRGKKALELSLRESLHLGHRYIGTEHVLLGALREDSGAVRRAVGVDAERLRSRVIELLNGSNPNAWSRPRWSSVSDLRSTALDNALDRTRELAASDLMTTGHLVTAVLADQRSQGAKVLASLGVTEEGFASALAQVPADGTSDGRIPTVEIRIGDTTTTIDDPDLIDALTKMPADQLRTTFNLLKQVIEKPAGPEAAA